MELEKYCTIYLVRHGQTHANVNKIVAGHFDSPLTEQGEVQARQRGEDLKAISFDAVFSSDLVRAKRTAELITLDKKLAVNTTKLIRERFFAEWEGRPEQEYLKENERLLNLRAKITEQEKRDFKLSLEYESYNDIASRMLLFLREIAATYLDKTVLVVAHGSIMRATLMHLGYVTHDELPTGSIENTGYVVLESDGVDFIVKETVGVNKIKSENK